jgi:hypothetical protein
MYDDDDDDDSIAYPSIPYIWDGNNWEEKHATFKKYQKYCTKSKSNFIPTFQFQIRV